MYSSSQNYAPASMTIPYNYQNVYPSINTVTQNLLPTSSLNLQQQPTQQLNTQQQNTPPSNSSMALQDQVFQNCPYCHSQKYNELNFYLLVAILVLLIFKTK